MTEAFIIIVVVSFLGTIDDFVSPAIFINWINTFNLTWPSSLKEASTQHYKF
jgi:hypothetical protein